MPALRHALIVSIAALVAATVPVASAAQERTENVDRTVALPASGTVELHNFSGRIRIRAGSGNDVVIKAIRRAEQPQLDGIKLTIGTSGSTVRIDANDRTSAWEDRDNNVVQTEFDIQLPASARLNVQAFSSNVEVEGVTGDQRLKTFSGDITVRGARGALRVESFNGRIDVDLAGAGRSPELEAETFNGEIVARLAPDASGDVAFDTFSGELTSDLALTMTSVGRKRTRATLPGGSGRSLSFKTFSGDVRVVR